MTTDLSLLRARLINVRNFADTQKEYDAMLDKLATEYGFKPSEDEDLLGEVDSAVCVMFDAVTRFEKEQKLPDWVDVEVAA